MPGVWSQGRDVQEDRINQIVRKSAITRVECPACGPQRLYATGRQDPFNIIEYDLKEGRSSLTRKNAMTIGPIRVDLSKPFRFMENLILTSKQIAT